MDNFYVYILIDPRNNLPFYVGKGKVVDNLGRKYRRIKDHIDLSDTQNRFKTAVIRKIQNLGLKVGIKIYKNRISELESLSEEILLIKKIGRRINGEGPLTNLTEGGEGLSGFIHSESTKKRQSLIRKKWLKLNKNPFEGKRHSKESRAQMSVAQKIRAANGLKPMKGKHHTEKTKRILSRKMKARGITLPKEEWFKFGSSGAKNPQAKTYIFTNPAGKQFNITGEFKKFIVENGLSIDTFKEYLNKGKIPPPKNPTHNRMTKSRLNSTGWAVRIFTGNT